MNSGNKDDHNKKKEQTVFTPTNRNKEVMKNSVNKSNKSVDDDSKLGLVIRGIRNKKGMKNRMNKSNMNEDDDSKLGLVVRVEKPLLSGIFEDSDEESKKIISSEDSTHPVLEELSDVKSTDNSTLRIQKESMFKLDERAEAYDPVNIDFDQFQKMFESPKRNRIKKKRRRF